MCGIPGTKWSSRRSPKSGLRITLRNKPFNKDVRVGIKIISHISLSFMMIMEKNIQTKLSDAELKDFEEICRREKLSKRQALQEAIKDWIKKKTGFDPKDPLFKDDPLSIDVKYDSSQVDEVVYKKKEHGRPKS